MGVEVKRLPKGPKKRPFSAAAPQRLHEPKFLIVVLATFVILILSVVLASALKYWIFPQIDQNLQSDLLWIVGTFIVLAGFFAALVQISGYSVRDFFSSQVHTSEKRDATRNVIRLAEEGLKADRHGKIDRERVGRLIDEIQANLYGDNAQLPKVLTQCSDLCDTAGLSDEYGEWLRRELNGFRDIEEFKKRFPDHDQYEAWMDKWMPHRQVNAHVKFAYRSVETGRREIKSLPLPKFFVVWSITFIIDTLKDAKEKGMGEMSFVLRDIAPDLFEKIRVENRKDPWNIEIPYDLQAFMNFAEFNRILNDVRERVLALLGRVRQILAEQP